MNSVNCPHCRARISSKSGFRNGQKVNCPKCDQDFTVRQSDLTGESGQQHEQAKGRPPIAARGRQDRDDEDVAHRGSRGHGAKGRSGRNESPSKKAKSNTYIVVPAVVVLLSLIGLGGWLIYQRIQANREAAAFNREMEERSAPEAKIIAPPAKYGPPPEPLLPVGMTAEAGKALLELARKLIGEWEGTSPERSPVRIILRDDGSARQFLIAGKETFPNDDERWRIVEVHDGGGIIEFWRVMGSRKLSFRLDDDGDTFVFVNTRFGEVSYRRKK